MCVIFFVRFIFGKAGRSGAAKMWRPERAHSRPPKDRRRNCEIEIDLFFTRMVFEKLKFPI